MFKIGDKVVCVNVSSLVFDTNLGIFISKFNVFKITENSIYKVVELVTDSVKVGGIDVMYHESRFMLLSEWRLQKIKKIMDVSNR